MGSLLSANPVTEISEFVPDVFQRQDILRGKISEDFMTQPTKPSETDQERDGQAEKELFKFTRLGYRGRIADLDAEGKSLLWRAGDLRARLLLNDIGTSLIENWDSLEVRRGCCQLHHAEVYLADRLAYELYPWPKNMFRVEVSE
jgi:hypothetical protein